MSWIPRRAPAPRRPAALVDAFIESYVSWRESCESVSAAYDEWVNCKADRRGRAFEDYRAALDWEELAAEAHAGRAASVHAVRA